jgi:hypothetical protein
MASSFDTALNLNGENKNHLVRVYKHKKGGLKANLRHRARDLTSEQLSKYTDYNPWNAPDTRNSKEAKLYEGMQLREANVSRDRFMESIGGHVFRRGARADSVYQDDGLEKQWNLIEAIRQGRVDMMDIGQGGGRPGFTYQQQNTRDPSIGLPPELAQVINAAWDTAHVLNPRLRKRKWIEPTKDQLDVGNLSEGDVTNHIPVKTSDYQKVDQVPAIDDRFTHTRVAAVKAAHQNALRNNRIFVPNESQYMGSFQSMAMPSNFGRYDSSASQAGSGGIMSSLSSGLNYVLKNSLGIDLEEQQQRQEFIKNLDDKFNTDKAAREAAATQAQAKYDRDRKEAQNYNKFQLDNLAKDREVIAGYQTTLKDNAAKAKAQIAKDQERARQFEEQRQKVQPYIENGWWNSYQKLESIRKHAKERNEPGMYTPTFKVPAGVDPRYYVPTYTEFREYFTRMSETKGLLGDEIRKYMPYQTADYTWEL